jgi:hypothetical protein
VIIRVAWGCEGKQGGLPVARVRLCSRPFIGQMLDKNALSNDPLIVTH